MNIQEAIVRLGLNTTALESRLQSFKSSFRSQLSGLAKSFGAAFAITSITAGLKSILDKFDDIQDKAENLNISPEFLQGIEYISSQDAIKGVKSFTAAIFELSKKLGDAKNGGAANIDIFQKYGISIQDIASMDAEQMFYKIAETIKGIPDPATRSAAAFELMGDAGVKMVGVLQKGGDALKAMVDQVDKLDAEKVKAIAEAQADLANAWQGISNFFSSFIGSALQKLYTLINGIKLISKVLGIMAVGWDDFDKAMEESARKQTEADKAAAIAAREAKRMLEVKKKEIDDNKTLLQLAAARKKEEAEIVVSLKAAAKAEAERIKSLRDSAGKYLTSKNQEFLPTLDELANSGIYQRDANRLQYLMGDAKESALWGNKDRRKRDLDEIQSIRQKLSKEGVLVDPNQGVIDQIKELSKEGMPVDIRSGLIEG